MQFKVLTIFPEIILDYANAAILGRAQKNNLIDLEVLNIRDFTEDKHKTVDDTPYGGGAGMVMKPEPIYKALESIDAIPFKKSTGFSKVKKIFSGDLKKKKKTILLSPRGKQFDQKMAEELLRYKELIFVCGRYEGVDERVVEHMVDEEISVGPYVLAGGELGALIIIEAISRLIPSVLGNEDSLKEETFSKNFSQDSYKQLLKEYPQYTKPAVFKGWKVPDVLLKGHHKEIKEWRENNSL
jgi:tRNA (guanine37-N1)-methyltransferase